MCIIALLCITIIVLQNPELLLVCCWEHGYYYMRNGASEVVTE